MDRSVLSIGLATLAIVSAAGAAGLQNKPAGTNPPPSQPAPAKPGTPAPAGGAAPKPADTPAGRADAAPRFKNADELLTGLETADRDLSSLRAQIQYTRDSGRLEGNVQTVRRGTIFYAARLGEQGAKADPKNPARRGFAVKFNEMTVDEVKRDEPREFVFDGEWIVERYPGEKQFFKRRVVPPGQVADPLRIGQGPFPIPIGQKRQDIQARFNTVLVDPLDGIDGAAQPRTKDIIERDRAYQLKLTPKPGAEEAREFKEIRIWYRADDLLPRMARTINREDGHAEVVLINLVRNETVDPKLFDTTPPKVADGWQVEVQEYRKRVEEPDAPPEK